MNSEVASIVDDCHLGGVILFAENVVDARQSVRLTHAFAGSLAGDTTPARHRSGGRHRHTPAVGHHARREHGAGRHAQHQVRLPTGHIIGEELKALGINTDYAAVVDVNVNPDNPVIGVRSFTSNLTLVAKLGNAYARGTGDAGTVTAAKNFP